MDLDLLKIDANAIEAGAWISDIPEFGEVEMHVRGFSSDAYKSFVAGRIKKTNRTDRDRSGALKPEIFEAIALEALVETILLDWRGIELAGEPLPYSKEKARELLSNPAYDMFKRAVEWAATRVGRFGDPLPE